MKDVKYLSKDETLERVSLYSRQGNERQFFDIEKVKKSYEQRQQKVEQDRIQRDAHYAQGMRRGLPHSSYKTLIQQRELEDQKSRVRLLKETKALYNKGNNLSKWLNKEVGNSLFKNKEISVQAKTKNEKTYRKLSKYFNKPVLSKQFNKTKTIDKER